MVMECVIQFSVISTLIYINTFCTFQVGECRQLFFPAKFMFGDRRLTKHTIATIKVVDFDLCEMQCYKQPNCVSINFNVIPDSEGLHECELNNATHQSHDHDHDLQNKKGYVYKGAESTCDRAVCENGGTCQSGFTDKGYHCVCPPGFISAHCEQDCQESWVEHNHSLYCMTSYRRHHMKNARQRCMEMSADLPIIKSQSENDFIYRLMENEDIEYVWLGMKRNNSGFFWFDGSPAEPSQGALYSAWKNNELEIGFWIHEKCAFLEFNTKRWRDHKCYHNKDIYVLCQKRLT